MTDTEMPQLQELMQTPEVQNAISSINPGLVQRRAFRPPRCAVFDQPFTVLEEAHGYRFEIDAEVVRHGGSLRGAIALTIDNELLQQGRICQQLPDGRNGVVELADGVGA